MRNLIETDKRKKTFWTNGKDSITIAQQEQCTIAIGYPNKTGGAQKLLR